MCNIQNTVKEADTFHRQYLIRNVSELNTEFTNDLEIWLMITKINAFTFEI